MIRTCGALAILVAFMLLTVTCSSGNVASNLRPDPKLDPHAKCGQTEPLIVEWKAPARGKLEALRAAGLIAVRYEGCDLEVLDCHAKGKYGYVSVTPKDEQVKMRD